MDASSRESLERGYLQIANICGLEAQITVVKRWLSNVPESWALILDNADDISLDLSPYFPVGDRGVILITSRNPQCKAHSTVGSYQLGAMSETEAVTLMLKTAGVCDLSSQSILETAKSVVLTLGCLALAITQAGAVIREGRCEIGDYCTLYARRRKELLSQKAIQGGEDYRHTVYTTWEVSWQMIKVRSSEAGQEALELLQIFGFLHHEGIPEEIFSQACHNLRTYKKSDWMLSHLPQIILRRSHHEWVPDTLRVALSVLLSFSLIYRDKENLISIHPLVHSWVRDRLGPSAEEMVWTQTTSAIALSIPNTFRTADYQFRRALVPHIDTCLSFRKEGIFYLGNIGDDCYRMASDFALVYSEAGEIRKALQLLERVVEIRKRTLGEEHPNTLRSMYNLANRYSEAGKTPKALRLNEQVVETEKKTLGEEHPDTLSSLHTLAIRYSEVNRRHEALELLERVVEIKKRTLGEEHFTTLTGMNNLGIEYRERGDKGKALQLIERVLEIRNKTLGKEHPKTLESMHNLAISYSEIGRGQEALQLREQVLEIRKRTLGEGHPDTLASIHALAISYSDIGRGQEALQLREQVLEIRKRTLGEEHPDTLRSIFALAVIYRKMGRGEALQLSKHVLEVRKRVLGEEHPDTLNSISIVAICYREIGRGEALQLSEYVLEVRKRVLGEEHPDTLDSMMFVAIIYREMGRGEALQLIEHILEVRKRVLGEEHPDTLDSIMFVAIIYREMGRGEALQLSEHMREVRKRVLGEEHPKTLDSMHDLATNYDEAGERRKHCS